MSWGRGPSWVIVEMRLTGLIRATAGSGSLDPVAAAGDLSRMTSPLAHLLTPGKNDPLSKAGGNRSSTKVSDQKQKRLGATVQGAGRLCSLLIYKSHCLSQLRIHFISYHHHVRHRNWKFTLSRFLSQGLENRTCNMRDSSESSPRRTQRSLAILPIFAIVFFRFEPVRSTRDAAIFCSHGYSISYLNEFHQLGMALRPTELHENDVSCQLHESAAASWVALAPHSSHNLIEKRWFPVISPQSSQRLDTWRRMH